MGFNHKFAYGWNSSPLLITSLTKNNATLGGVSVLLILRYISAIHLGISRLSWLGPNYNKPIGKNDDKTKDQKNWMNDEIKDAERGTIPTIAFVIWVDWMLPYKDERWTRPFPYLPLMPYEWLGRALAENHSVNSYLYNLITLNLLWSRLSVFTGIGSGIISCRCNSVARSRFRVSKESSHVVNIL